MTETELKAKMEKIYQPKTEFTLQRADEPKHYTVVGKNLPLTTDGKLTLDDKTYELTDDLKKWLVDAKDGLCPIGYIADLVKDDDGNDTIRIIFDVDADRHYLVLWQPKNNVIDVYTDTNQNVIRIENYINDITNLLRSVDDVNLIQKYSWYLGQIYKTEMDWIYRQPRPKH